MGQTASENRSGSKTDVALKNEGLAKMVCHNICCVIQEMHESGVDPTFWGEAQAV